ncbi:MAG: hypothetical protein GEU93_16140 [Propionibacteriales bacterium]|nr:hypothetical protein [Propionibacteriales bacterium]
MGPVAAQPAQQQAEAEPPIHLMGTKDSVTLRRWGKRVYLRLGVQAATGDSPFEIWSRRASYSDPIEAARVVNRGGSTHEEPLPDGLLENFRGLPDFTRVIVRNANGRKVVDRTKRWCPNGGGARTTPDAPASSPYPRSCPGNRWTLGSVWGVPEGWRTSLWNGWGMRARLPVGRYTAVVWITKEYREIFDIPRKQGKVTVKVRVRDGGRDGGGFVASHRTAAAQAQSPDPQPSAREPGGRERTPQGPRPDLRALPAWAVRTASPGDRDFLRFAANVWNAGPSPLVVDGFRREGEDVMDAYQFFYNEDGEQVGYANTGTMEWDARDGHRHWHFTDFARYRLLDADGELAVRSHKEAFCLANTDAIDYTVDNANWRPGGTDLHTACGGKGALSVREVLDVGSGDTYYQYTPGQSFNITNLPNGTYYIEVTANPDGRLYETSMDNNVTLRKVVLKGRPGDRKVVVKPYVDPS